MLIDILLSLIFAIALILVCSDGSYFPLPNLIGLTLLVILAGFITKR